MPTTRTSASVPGSDARRMPTAPRGTRRAPPGAQVLAEMSTRRAWGAAAGLRQEFHLRILAAYRRQLEGLGTGPSDQDLRLFASIAVAEHRLRRAFERAKVRPTCNIESSSIRLAARLRRGEFQ